MKQIQFPVMLLSLSMAVLSGKAQIAPTTSFIVEGIKVIYKPTLKNIVNVSIYFRGGVGNYPDDQAGIEKLAVEGAVECGNAKYDKNNFSDQSDKFGIHIAGSSDMDYSRISLNCISKYFEQGWDLLSSAILTPAYEEDAFGKLKQKAIAGLRQSESDPDSRLRTASFRATFAGTTYAIDPAGTEATLSLQTASGVKDYYFKTLLNKTRIFIVVVGNVSKEVVSAKISVAFASIKPSDYHLRLPIPPSIVRNTVNVEERALSTNYITGIMNAPEYSSPDYVPFLLAFSELHGIMYTEIRVRRNLSYLPNDNVNAAILPWSNVYVSTTSPKESVAIIINILKYMKKKNINRNGLTQIKALYITGNYRKLESTDAIAQSLGKAEVLGGWEISEQMLANIQNTTRDQMTDVFNKYINGVSWTYLGNKDKADEAMDAFNRSVD